MTTARAATETDNNPTWVPRPESAGVHPHMTDDFARVYEATGQRIAGQIAAVAIDRVGGIGWGTRVLDIAAGAGALSLPVPLRGASILAIDNAPGMVKLLAERLAPFPSASVRGMDGQQLLLEDASFDATFSMIGVSIFPDWRRGLAEQVRVTRAGGKACVATWRKMPGGGPFVIMAQALRATFPDMPPPAAPQGFIALAEPERLSSELADADLAGIELMEFDVVWEGPAGPAYLDEVRELHGYMGFYTALDDDQRRRVDEAILTVVDRLAEDGRVCLRSPVVMATGTKN